MTRDTFLLVFPGQWGSVGLPAGLTGTARALVGVPLILGLVAFFVLAVLTGSAARRGTRRNS